MPLNASIFKAYDIRGVVPSTIDEGVAEALGLAFGTRARAEGEKSVAVGRDGRLSGPMLAAALVRGLAASGVDVIDVGMVTTPMLYFAANTLSSSGIQVTGSHNPKDYNGFKMVLAGRAIYGDEIQALRQLMETNRAKPADLPGNITHVNIEKDYRERIVSGIQLERPMKIVIDSGNGIAGASAPGIFRALGCEVTELFSEVDGNFPNHHPDPSKPENLKDLIAALQTGDAELGLAFDGDGDRLGIVTKDGTNIYPDRQMMLFARDVLSRVPGGTILFDVKCSQRLAPEIEAAGGVAMMYKTGHSLIKARMKEVHSPLGGEMSGHIFFKERWYGFDDGTYAGARLLEILSRAPDAGVVLNALPTSFSTPELNVPCKEGEPHTVVKQLVEMAIEAQRSDGPPLASTAPLGGRELHAVSERGGQPSFSDVPPLASTAPSGGRELHAVSERGGQPFFGDGPPLSATASSGSSVLHKAKSVGARLSTIDGVRVDWPDGFGLIRASNTTPVLVLRFEGHTEAALHRIEADMLALLRSVKPDASFATAAH